MQRPLPAAPGTAGMDEATLAKEDTMAVLGFHLDTVATDPPVAPSHLLLCHRQTMEHPLLVILVQRDGSFPLATETTAFATEYFRQFHLECRYHFQFFSSNPVRRDIKYFTAGMELNFLISTCPAIGGRIEIVIPDEGL